MTLSGVWQMLFSSNVFIFRFLILFMLIYVLAQERYRNEILLTGSLIFYGIGEPHFIWIMFTSVVINYFLSQKIYQKKCKPLFVVTILLNIFLLGWFKYLNFGLVSINFKNIYILIGGFYFCAYYLPHLCHLTFS